MNVQGLKQTIVIPTLCVTTRRDPTSVAVLVGFRETVKTAQVNSYAVTNMSVHLYEIFLSKDHGLVSLHRIELIFCHVYRFFVPDAVCFIEPLPAMAINTAKSKRACLHDCKILKKKPDYPLICIGN